MNSIVLEIAIIALLLLFNGLLAMTEIAVVSSRKTRLQQLADRGDAKAAAALKLAAEPDRFLASVQIGITLVGVLAGAFGGATLAEQIGSWVSNVPVLAKWSEAIGVAIVVPLITIGSLIFGELVPKRIGLAYPEVIARFAARPMQKLSHCTSWIISFLAGSANAILHLFRIKPTEDGAVSEDDVRLLVREGGKSGALLPQESAMVEAVLELDQLRVRELMTPQRDIVWLDVALPPHELCATMIASGHLYFPLHEGRRSNLLGVVSLKDAFAAMHRGETPDFRALVKPALLVPPTQPALILLNTFRERGETFAVVADEFGGISGVVSAHDILEAISGDFQSHREKEPHVVQREDGSWLIDASIYIDDLEDHFPDFPVEPAGRRIYVTLNGFILEHLGRIPATGESFTIHDYRIEIMDLDGHRIDKILLTRTDSAQGELKI